MYTSDDEDRGLGVWHRAMALDGVWVVMVHRVLQFRHHCCTGTELEWWKHKYNERMTYDCPHTAHRSGVLRVMCSMFMDP